MTTTLPPLVRNLPPAPDPDAMLDGFVSFVADQGISLYEAQENAILELVAGSNVILNTPTGSGKSLVAAAAHFVGLAQDKRSFYTAPIKALVSEKFFSLCQDFGSDRVGMITGDASVNPDAPIICCTAEILANRALRDGHDTDVDVVIMDEFHYYSDPQRGWAWQIPLLELPHCQFLLMSATLGDTSEFESQLTDLTGRPTELVSSATRPVPLEFEYRTTNLHKSVSDLLDSGRSPIYLVHFTQREATEAAQGYLSIDPLTKEEKQRVKEAIGGFRFDSPIGPDLRKYILGGIGVHHAGLLPKYRLLVEKLAQEGLLKIISGTDTLGVGVNVPIRSVLFTQLCKYDGRSTRLLSNREFAQIAGRAGRKGYDSVGHVWVQAPEHVVENLKADEKAAADPKRKKKANKKKAPERGYAHWTQDTFERMVNGKPEPLTSSFQVNHQMVMSLLDRPGDGCAAVRSLLTNNHETRKRQRNHIRRTIGIYRSLIEAELLELLDEPDEDGRMVRVMLDLQDEFALHQPLSLWAIEAIEQLNPENPDHELSVLTVIESILESPGVIIAAQVEMARKELLADLKARGVEYEERLERLAEVEPPRPNKEWLFESFDRFRAVHPWVGGNNVAPKSIVRDMYEQAMTFKELVGHYGLKRAEGVVLRYLSDTYKALIQNIPDEDKTDELDDITEWLGEIVRQVDSSLIDEWEKLRNPPDDTDSQDPSATSQTENDGQRVTVLANPRAFRVMVRTEAFRWVNALALGHSQQLPLDESEHHEVEAGLTTFTDEYGDIMIDAAARAPHHFRYDPARNLAVQTLNDSDDVNEWRLVLEVDEAASAEEGKAVLRYRALAPLGEPRLTDLLSPA